MQTCLSLLGRCLESLPSFSHESTEEERIGCRALQCVGCCYLYDVLCTIPYMRSVETGHNRINLALFAFYEPCWPCMCCLQLCCCYTNEDIQRMPRSMGFYALDHEPVDQS